MLEFWFTRSAGSSPPSIRPPCWKKIVLRGEGPEMQRDSVSGVDVTCQSAERPPSDTTALTANVVLPRETS